MVAYRGWLAAHRNKSLWLIWLVNQNNVISSMASLFNENQYEISM